MAKGGGDEEACAYIQSREGVVSRPDLWWRLKVSPQARLLVAGKPVKAGPPARGYGDGGSGEQANELTIEGELDGFVVLLDEVEGEDAGAVGFG